MLNVFYADMTGYNYRNDIHYGKDDLFCKLQHIFVAIFITLPSGFKKKEWIDAVLFFYLAAMAGLMGLGFGFSILSAVEILYFTIVRWIFHRLDAPSNSSFSSSDQTPSVMDENIQENKNQANHLEF